jgi:hypothetical protein
MGLSLSRAFALVSGLDSSSWDLFEAVGRLAGERAAAGQTIRQRLAEAFEADELAVSLAQALKDAQQQAVKLLADTPPVPSPPAGPVAGWQVVSTEDRVPAGAAVDRLQKQLDRLDDERRKRAVVSWRIEEKGTS